MYLVFYGFAVSSAGFNMCEAKILWIIFSKLLANIYEITSYLWDSEPLKKSHNVDFEGWY